MMDLAEARLPLASLLCKQTVLGLLDPHSPSVSSNGKLFFVRQAYLVPKKRKPARQQTLQAKRNINSHEN